MGDDCLIILFQMKYGEVRCRLKQRNKKKFQFDIFSFWENVDFMQGYLGEVFGWLGGRG